MSPKGLQPMTQWATTTAPAAIVTIIVIIEDWEK